MMKTFCRCVISIVFASTLFAGDDWYSAGKLNGHYWQSMDDLVANYPTNDLELALVAFKSAFLAGYDEGVHGTATVAKLTPEQTKDINDFTIPAIRIQEIREALDQFYSAPERRNIPIVIAISFINRKFRGMTQKEYDEELAQTVAIFNAVVPTKERGK